MERRLLVLFALVLAAGCGTAPTGETETLAPQLRGTVSPTGTVTPATTTSLPPGVSVTGESVTVASDRLAGTHRRLLRRDSRTVRRETVIRAANGTVIGRNTAIVRATRETVGEVRVRVLTSGTNPTAVGLSPARIELWTNGSAAASRRTVGDETTYTYQGPPIPPGPATDTTGHRLVSVAFDLVNVTAFDRLSEGLYRVTGRTARSSVGRNVSLVALLTADGVVQRLRLSYVRVTDGQRRRVVRRLYVTNRGETTVQRPSWLALARNASEPDTDTATPALEERRTGRESERPTSRQPRSHPFGERSAGARSASGSSD